MKVKCWKSKNGKICRGLFYINKSGDHFITFDRFAIIALIGSVNYSHLKEGDEFLIVTSIVDYVHEGV